MGILKKISESKRILTKTVEENEQYKEFIDIVSKLLYQENERVIAEFSAGKRLKDGFLSFIGSYTERLKVLLGTDCEEPMLIFRDGHRLICSIDLLSMKNVETAKEECDAFTRYTIYFNYITKEIKLDYHISFLVMN